MLALLTDAILALIVTAHFTYLVSLVYLRSRHLV